MPRVYKAAQASPRRYFTKQQQDYYDNKSMHNWDNFKGQAREYSSKQWQRLREDMLYEHPLCILCEKPATEVHHKLPVHKAPELFYKIDNLATLCYHCHDLVNRAYKRGITWRTICQK